VARPTVGQLPDTVTTVGRVLARELRYQLVGWRLLVDRTSDPELREALYRKRAGPARRLLEAHRRQPLVTRWTVRGVRSTATP